MTEWFLIFEQQEEQSKFNLSRKNYYTFPKMNPK